MNQREEEPELPRPLHDGEVYCHICKTYVLFKDLEEHRKQCRRKGDTL
jgi:uncharacterized Zn finger protein (UPF0148 family)